MKLTKPQLALIIAQGRKIANLSRRTQYLETQMDMAFNGLRRFGSDYQMTPVMDQKFTDMDVARHGISKEKDDKGNWNFYYFDQENNNRKILLCTAAAGGNFFIPAHMYNGTHYENDIPLNITRATYQIGRIAAEMVRTTYFEGYDWFEPRKEDHSTTAFPYPDGDLLDSNRFRQHLSSYMILGQNGANEAVDPIMIEQMADGRIKVAGGNRAFDKNKKAVRGGMVDLRKMYAEIKAEIEKLGSDAPNKDALIADIKLKYQKALENTLIKKVLEEDVEEGYDIFQPGSTSAQMLSDKKITPEAVDAAIEQLLKGVGRDLGKAPVQAMLRALIAKEDKDVDAATYINNLIAHVSKFVGNDAIKVTPTEAKETAFQLRAKLWKTFCPELYHPFHDQLAKRFAVGKKIPNFSDARNDGLYAHMETTTITMVISEEEMNKLATTAGLTKSNTEEMRENGFYLLEDFANGFSDHPSLILNCVLDKLESGELQYTEALHQQLIAFANRTAYFEKVQDAKTGTHTKEGLIALLEKIELAKQKVGVETDNYIFDIPAIKKSLGELTHVSEYMGKLPGIFAKQNAVPGSAADIIIASEAGGSATAGGGGHSIQTEDDPLLTNQKKCCVIV